MKIDKYNDNINNNMNAVINEQSGRRNIIALMSI